MKKHKFKPKEIKVRGIIPGIKTICGICRKGLFEGHRLEFNKIISNIQWSEENYSIKKLGNIDGVQMSSTLGGQRELIRQYRNKINEIINWVNNYEKTK